jgi:hypothetical protein
MHGKESFGQTVDQPTTPDPAPASDVEFLGGSFVQPAITGYRQLSEADAALMNEVKAHGAALETLCNKLRNNARTDQRWVATGVTDLQKGLMCLTRAVAKPTHF